jgi:hypothetical protein
VNSPLVTLVLPYGCRTFVAEGLDVLNVFTSGAEVVVDGVRQTPVSRVFTSKIDHDIIIVKDTNGNLRQVHRSQSHLTGGGNAYATVTSDDLDGKKVELFNQEAVMSPGETRRLRGLQVDNFVDASERITIDYDRRSLQEGCSSFDVIKVAILVDSNLCAYAGSYDNASTLTQSIVAATSEYYEVTGLCKKLMISYLEIYCNPGADPVQPFLS